MNTQALASSARAIVQPGKGILAADESTLTIQNLNAINAMGRQPWELSFSFGRALQEDALKAWQGRSAEKPRAQRVFYHRARCNSMARNGAYTGSMEKEAP
jgi:fructose-bisphosphate aldolase class I